MMERIENHNEQEKILEFYIQNGVSLFEEGEYLKATECFVEAIDICRRQKNDKMLAELMLGAGKSFIRLGNTKESRKYVNQALTLHEHLNIVSGIAGDLECLGDIESFEKKYELALKSYEKSIDVRKKAKIEPESADLYEKIGTTYVYLSNFELGYKSFQRAYEILQIEQDTEFPKNLKAAILESLGICANRLLWHDKAITHFLNSLEIYDTLQDIHHKIMVLKFLGNEYYDTSNYSKSVLYYTECLEIIEANNKDYSFVAIDCLYNMADMKMTNMEYTKALEYNKKGLNLVNKNENKLCYLHFLLQQGLCYIYSDETDKANLILNSSEFLNLINEYGTNEEKEIYKNILSLIEHK